MATDVCRAQWWDYVLGRTLAKEPKLSLPPEYDPRFIDATHTSLQVHGGAPGSPQPDDIKVTVFDPSKNRHIPFTLKSTDTSDTLVQKYLQVKPELGKHLHLIYNGKPVPAQTCLTDLGVKTGAMFITYQKCTGG